MYGDLLLIVMILVVGVVAFFFGAIYMICRFFGFVGRFIWSLFTRRPWPRIRAAMCYNPHCRNVENRPAKYCSRCGTEFLRK